MAKIDIISGFLGAGKTTLIKKLLEEVFKGEKVVLIENEYGEVGIDGGFLKDAGIEITEMNSGCICCSLVGDFTKSLGEVCDRFHPDRILVEPSGVGKLSDVMASVVDVEKSVPVKLNALVTVVNANKALKQMKAFGEFFNNQVEFATTIVLSRTQEIDDAKLEEVVNVMKEKNPNAAIITTPWNELNGETILAAVEKKSNLLDDLMKEAHEAHEAHEHEHHHHEHDHGEEHDHCCHHDHDHEEEHDHCCHHDHDHEEEHDHCCHHDHDHDHEEEHDHCCHHDHDHEEHEHHHHHDHHADEVFTSIGIETPHKFDRSVVEKALDTLVNSEKYESTILRAKGMIPATDGKWIYFDMVPGDYEMRDGAPDYTGRLVVIGTSVNEAEIKELFGM
ncbi:MAG: GTP-binding protein [Lachnospiraceae bacterium]|nr:GTP-binding protein [Lachnospiraceae bacterium]